MARVDKDGDNADTNRSAYSIPPAMGWGMFRVIVIHMDFLSFYYSFKGFILEDEMMIESASSM